MANYLSQPTKYGEPKSQFNAELASKVLQAKQGQYDINKARVDAVLGEYQNLEFINAEAKEDFYNNIQGVLNEVNSSNLRDLGDTSVADKILGSINKALTPETLKHNQIAKAYYASEKKWEKLFEKDPKLHDLGNKQYVERVSGINDYMQNGDYSKVNLGMLTNPIEYVDVEKEIKEGFQELKKLRGKEEHSWYDSEGTKHVMDMNYMSVSDMYMTSPSVIGSKAKRQIEITASNNLSSDINSLRREIEFIDRIKVDQVGADIENLKAISNSAYTSGKHIDILRNKIRDLEIYGMELASKEYDSIEDVRSAQMYVLENNYVMDVANQMGVNPSTDITLPAHILKSMGDAKNAKTEYSPYTPFALPTEGEDSKDVYFETQEKRRNLDGQLNEAYDAAYSSITNNLSSKEIDSYRNKIIGSAKDEELTEEQIRVGVVKDYSQNHVSGNDEYDIVTLIRSIGDLEKERAYMKGATDKANRMVEKERAAMMSATLYDDVLTNWTSTMMVTLDGRRVDAREYLSGINTQQEMTEFLESEESNEFKAALYADATVNSLGTVDAFSEHVLETEAYSNMHLDREALQNTFVELTRFTGEDLSVQDAFSFRMAADPKLQKDVVVTGEVMKELTPEQTEEYLRTGKVEGFLGNSAQIRTKDEFKNTNTYNILRNQIELGGYKKRRYSALGLVQQELKTNLEVETLMDRSGLRALADLDNYKETYNRVYNSMGLDQINVGFSIPSRKDADDPVFTRLQAIAGSPASIEVNKKYLGKGEESSPFHLVHNKPTYVSFDPLSPDLVMLSQLNQEGKYSTTRVLSKTIEELDPELYQNIIGYRNTGETKYNSNIEMSSDMITYINNEDVVISRYNHFPKEVVDKATEYDAKKAIVAGIRRGGEAITVQQTIESAIDNSQDFSLKIVSKRDVPRPYYKIVLEHKDFGEVHSLDALGDPPQEIWDRFNVMPSSLMTNMLEIIVNDYGREGQISKSKPMSNLVNIYSK